MAQKKERAPWIRRYDGDTWIRKDNQGVEHQFQKIDGKTVRLKRVTPYADKHKQKSAHIPSLNPKSTPHTGVIKEKPNPLTHERKMVKIDSKTYKEVWVPKNEAS